MFEKSVQIHSNNSKILVVFFHAFKVESPSI